MNAKILNQDDEPPYENRRIYRFSGVPWEAILAGSIVAIGLSFLINLLVMGLGISVYSIASGEDTANKFALGGYIFILILGVITYFSAGWLTGYLGKSALTSTCRSFTYGFMTWCFALIISFLLVGYISDFLGYELNALTNANNISIITTTNPDSPSDSMNRSTNMGDAETERRDAASANSMMVNPEKAQKAVAKGILSLFVLFLAGALSAAFGAYFAVKNRDDLTLLK